MKHMFEGEGKYFNQYRREEVVADPNKGLVSLAKASTLLWSWCS
jgi:hypothetical protein